MARWPAAGAGCPPAAQLAALPGFDFCRAPIPPAKLQARLATTLCQGRRIIQAGFEAGGDAGQVLRHHCRLIDDLVCALLDAAALRLPSDAGAARERPMAVVALGGYGRGELHPYSDLDLVFITGGGGAGPVPGFLLHMLWDLGFAVRHAVGSVDDCLAVAREDRRLRTRLLDARRLWGSEGLFAQLSERFAGEVLVANGARYLEASVQEVLRRRHRFDAPEGIAEPDVKLGKGGLRDLHALHWMHKIQAHLASIEAGQATPWQTPPRRLTTLRDFLWNVRCHLHYLADRLEDRLSFELQPRVARRMAFGDGQRDLMRRYQRVSDEVCALFEDQVSDWRRAAA